MSENVKTAPPAKSKNVRLFGERVIFEPVAEEISGSLEVASGVNRGYEVGRVLIVGDGVAERNGVKKTVPMLVNPGDYVWFQVNPFQASNNMLRLDGVVHMTIHKHDLLARLTKPTVAIENIEFIGTWSLLEPFEDERKSKIIIPGTVTDSEVRMLRYRVVQAGSEVEGAKVGDEVIIDKKMAHHVRINGADFFYIDSKGIIGVVES